jgi:cyclophilin family peptidyl-prolyl cis-trans isomerase
MNPHEFRPIPAGAMSVTRVLALLLIALAAPRAEVWNIDPKATLGGAIRVASERTIDAGKVAKPEAWAFDEKSVSFDVAFADGITARFARIGPAAPASSNTLDFTLPALAAGKWTITPYVAGSGARFPTEVIVAPSESSPALGLEIETSAGKLFAEFDPKSAPAACLWVAKLASEKRYDDRAIERVLRGGLIQIGSTDPARAPLPDRATIPLDPSPASHVRGALSLWRGGVAGEDPKRAQRADTGNGTFFICLSDEPYMNGRYCVFGRVVAGLEVLDGLAKQPLVVAENGELSKPKEAARVVAVRLVPVSPAGSK